MDQPERFTIWISRKTRAVVGLDAIATARATNRLMVVYTEVASGKTWVEAVEEFTEEFERYGDRQKSTDG